MRNIQISTDVFQAIWAARLPNEEEEDAILRRLLDITASNGDVEKADIDGKPWIDRQYGISFPHGFEMYRRRKGKELRAQVVDGKWQVNGQSVIATSINQVSKAVGAGGETGWVGWNYRVPSGEEKKISEMRDPDKIIRRTSLQFDNEFLDKLIINI